MGARSSCPVAEGHPNGHATGGDQSSAANFHEACITHSTYELDVNFETKCIEGYAQIDITILQPSASEVVLDTSGLVVSRVELLLKKGALPLTFVFTPAAEALGTPMHVQLPDHLGQGQQITLGVRYRTSPGATALQFLDPQQTAGGKLPYLFSQCETVHARSFVPCQDTPSVKAPYRAAVRVPQGLTALMSAVQLGEGPEDIRDLPHLADVTPSQPSHVFYYEQRVPVPSYLTALAVGELESRELGPSSRIWAEPCVVEAAAWEFGETAKFLEAGVSVAGEYEWGRYDLLLLPPSFPYGGMENPCLTFVTPTLLAGDRSMTNVIAHEIAHSWTGNLVTNASWDNFWMNEGFTVFLERKILGRVMGWKVEQFKALRGLQDLTSQVADLGPGHMLTALVPQQVPADFDPDNYVTSIPYEKGFYFLYHLQDVVGGPEAFEPFLAAYIKAFQYRTTDSLTFRNFFEEHFKDVPGALQVDWDTWLYGRGMPPLVNRYDTELADQAFALAARWHESDPSGKGGSGPPGASPSDVEGLSADQVVAFLGRLGELRGQAGQPLGSPTTRLMAKTYGLYEKKNSEIRCAWYRLAVAAEDDEALGPCTQFLRSMGRMKFLVPLYKALYNSAMGRDLALKLFQEVRATYHPIAQKAVADVLGLGLGLGDGSSTTGTCKACCQ